MALLTEKFLAATTLLMLLLISLVGWQVAAAKPTMVQKSASIAAASRLPSSQPAEKNRLGNAGLLADLQISSDQLIVDRLSNSASFQGQVVIWFDDLIVKTTDLKIIYQQINGKNQLKSITAPNRITAKNYQNTKIITADRGEYSAKHARLVLTGNVKLSDHGRMIATEQLIYHAAVKQVTASSSKLQKSP